VSFAQALESGWLPRGEGRVGAFVPEGSRPAELARLVGGHARLDRAAVRSGERRVECGASPLSRRDERPDPARRARSEAPPRCPGRTPLTQAGVAGGFS
jgi:hypothetical protein